MFEPVDAPDEFEILGDRQVLVEAEALRHVADMALDGVALMDDVIAQTGAAAVVSTEQPAEHADEGGLATAVRAQESEDFPLLHLKADVIDDSAISESLGHALHVNGDVIFHGWACFLNGFPKGVTAPVARPRAGQGEVSPPPGDRRSARS